MQEIRFAILTAEEGELFRVASSLIRRLARDFGYSRRKGKDNFEAFYRENAIPYDPAQEALLQEVENEDKYLVYRFGGRSFGKSGWAGVAHSGKTLVFVSREWDRSAPALVRLMSKKHEAGENEYLVIEPAQDTTLSQSRAYYVEDYYKTTMKGFGRDRSLTHVIEGEYDVVLEGGTSSRSGRFGNSFQLLIADELKIEEEGVA